MASLHIRNAGEERESEPMISQKAHARVCKEKDHQYHLIYIERKQMQVLAEEEKLIINALNVRLTRQERITYLVGGIAYIIGGVTAWLML